MDNLNERIAALSPQEKETHAALIAECMERQREIRGNTRASYAILVQLARDGARLAAALQQRDDALSTGLQGLEASMQYAIGALSHAVLLLTPTNNTYKS